MSCQHSGFCRCSRRLHEKKGHMVGGEELRWLWIIMWACVSLSVWLSNAWGAYSTFRLSRLTSSPKASHFYCVALYAFITPFLSLISLILSISVFLTTLPCLDSHRWGRLCHIADRWIARGTHMLHNWAVSFSLEAQIHKQTRMQYVERFCHYIAPDRVYMYTVIDECHPYRHRCLPISAPHVRCPAAMLLLYVTNAGRMEFQGKGHLKGNFIPVG